MTRIFALQVSRQISWLVDIIVIIERHRCSMPLLSHPSRARVLYEYFRTNTCTSGSNASEASDSALRPLSGSEGRRGGGLTVALLTTERFRNFFFASFPSLRFPFLLLSPSSAPLPFSLSPSPIAVDRNFVAPVLSLSSSFFFFLRLVPFTMKCTG